MYLSRLLIKNYKSINQLSLTFKKGKNIIVGKNNAGKSNIIKAIDLLLGDSSPTYDRFENINDNDFFNGDQSKKIIIFCELTRDVGEELNYEEMYKCFGFKVLVKIKEWEVTPSGKKQPIKEPIRVPLPYLDSFYTNIEEIFNIDEDSSDYEYANPKLKNQQSFEKLFSDKYKFAYAFLAFKDENGKIIKQIRFLFKENEDEDWIMAFTAPIRNELLQSAIIPSFRDPQNQLRITAWNWYGKLLKKTVDCKNQKLRQAFEQVKEASNEIFAKLEKNINDSKVNIAFPNTSISFQFNPGTNQDIHKSALIYVNDGFNSLLQDKGSGIQSVVIIGLFHFYTREIVHVSSSLLAIEEPELFLHPHGRRIISNRLDDFLEKGKNQVIVTTHSAEFINSSQENLNIVVVTKNQNETSAINTTFDTAKEKQILIKTQNAEMFFADQVILVEGNGDKYILEAIAKEMGRRDTAIGENWINDLNISIIAVGGKPEFWKYCEKLSQINIPWYVISDWDFFREGLSDFLTKLELHTLKQGHNTINSQISQTTTITPTLQQSVDEFKEVLKSNNIFVLSGELEDYYLEEAKVLLQGIRGKEEKPLHIVSNTFESGKTIDELVNISEYELFLRHMLENTKPKTVESGSVSENAQTVFELVAPEVEIVTDDTPF